MATTATIATALRVVGISLAGNGEAAQGGSGSA